MLLAALGGYGRCEVLAVSTGFSADQVGCLVFGPVDHMERRVKKDNTMDEARFRQALADPGHVLLRWTRGGVIYAVSLHGHSSVNREVELDIAQHIDYVAP
jgi:hypothetical protein